MADEGVFAKKLPFQSESNHGKRSVSSPGYNVVMTEMPGERIVRQYIVNACKSLDCELVACYQQDVVVNIIMSQSISIKDESGEEDYNRRYAFILFCHSAWF
ncbi:hypothetical protein LDC_1237 [sediment metagenome]|uniref:Uncharacterized protein n=1 Tax=sediment metagenome TaxID=749907 RepID=D9PI82_9ZZZZ